MTSHKFGTREEWLAARLELLDAEKELTRRSDELARRRQELPWVRIGKEYRFGTDQGPASLADLFQGRSQLLIYHFMFGPGYTAGCPACSAIADGFNGLAIHLANHDVMLWRGVARSARRSCRAIGSGWAGASPGPPRPGATSTTTSTSPSPRSRSVRAPSSTTSASRPCGRRRRMCAGRSNAWAATTGTDWATYTRERPGMSAFALDDGIVYHTYSAYARGLDGLWGMYQWLDRAPRGRNEARGPDDPLNWFRRHDEYDSE